MQGSRDEARLGLAKRSLGGEKVEAVKGDDSSPQSLFCVTKVEACWAIGTGWNLKSEDLNTRTEMHQLDDLNKYHCTSQCQFLHWQRGFGNTACSMEFCFAFGL